MTSTLLLIVALGQMLLSWCRTDFWI